MFRQIFRISVLKEREIRSFWSLTRAIFSHVEGILAAPSLDPNKTKKNLFLLFAMSQKSNLAGRSANERLRENSTTQNLLFFHTPTAPDSQLQENDLQRLVCRLEVLTFVMCFLSAVGSK